MRTCTRKRHKNETYLFIFRVGLLHRNSGSFGTFVTKSAVKFSTNFLKVNNNFSTLSIPQKVVMLIQQFVHKVFKMKNVGFFRTVCGDFKVFNKFTASTTTTKI